MVENAKQSENKEQEKRVAAAKKTATARATEARISLKHSVAICRNLKGRRVVQAKALLEGMSIGKMDLGGKHYTKASRHMLEMLNSAEANAVQKGMDVTKLFVAAAKPSKGRVFLRPRTRGKRRGEVVKSSNIEITLEER